MTIYDRISISDISTIGKVDKVLTLVGNELIRATNKFPPMHSPHEGWAVIREELKELDEHVCGDTGRSDDAMKEAIQIAAMACRYVLDLSQRGDSDAL